MILTEGIASGGTMQYYIGETPPAADSSDWQEELPVARSAVASHSGGSCSERKGASK